MWYEGTLVAYLSYAQTFVDLYQASIKAKGKEIEMNFTDGDELNLTYYDIDFFGGPSEKTNHLINDEKINVTLYIK